MGLGFVWIWPRMARGCGRTSMGSPETRRKTVPGETGPRCLMPLSAARGLCQLADLDGARVAVDDDPVAGLYDVEWVAIEVGD